MAVREPRREWEVVVRAGPAATLHGASPTPAHRQLRRCRARGMAVVLGSGQPATDVDPGRVAALGATVVRRRSGGGAVLVVPSEVVWMEAWLPAGDPLWTDDVARASWWLGEAWVDALRSLGFGGGSVHRGGLERSPWGRLLCFAAVGPGEVCLGSRKVIGIAQRRSREGALFQSAASLLLRAEELAGVLALPAGVRQAGGEALRRRAGSLAAPGGGDEPAFPDPVAVEDALVTAVLEGTT